MPHGDGSIKTTEQENQPKNEPDSFSHTSHTFTRNVSAPQNNISL